MNKQEIEMAIKEITGDKKAFEAVNHGGFTNKIKAFELAISALEQQLTNGWIPVRERLPEEKQTVFITFINQAGAHTGESVYKEGKFIYVSDTDNGYYEEVYSCVIAWQPLPEPYKEVPDAD